MVKNFIRSTTSLGISLKERFAANKVEIDRGSVEEKSIKTDEISKDKVAAKVKDDAEVKKVAKSQPEVS